MDESATDVATSPPAPDDPLRPYRSWATVLFMILVLTGLLGIAVVVAAAQGAGTRVILVAASTAVLGVAVFAVAAFGLDRRAPWAVHAVQPICLVLIVSGLLRSGLALASGRIDIPLEVIGALLVFTRDHRPELLPAIDPGGHRMMSLVVGAVIAVQLLPVLGDLLVR